VSLVAALAVDFLRPPVVAVGLLVADVWLVGTEVIFPCWIKLFVTNLSKPFARFSGTGLAVTETAPRKKADTKKLARQEVVIFMVVSGDAIEDYNFVISLIGIAARIGCGRRYFSWFYCHRKCREEHFSFLMSNNLCKSLEKDLADILPISLGEVFTSKDSTEAQKAAPEEAAFL
jgi:hypothetical protein